MSYLPPSRFVRTIALVVAVLVGPAAAVMGQTPAAFRRAWQSGKPVTVTGMPSAIYVDDFKNRRSELVYMIRDERSKKLFQLHFEKALPHDLKRGTRITVSGHATGSDVYVLADQMLTTTAPVSSTSSGTTVTNITPVSGDQKTLVMVANFQDQNVSCSTQEIDDLMFSNPLGKSVDGLYRHMSAGTVSFSGTVVGPYTLNVSSTDVCDYVTWSDAMDTMAARDGLDVSAYARKVYMVPSTTCAAAGYAELGKTPSRAWMFVCNSPDVLAHELGHNLGLQHASSPDNEYGDGSDYMGLGRGLFRELGAPHKFEMGWIPAAPLLTQDGQYTIAPLETDAASATAAQTLRVFKPDTNEHYYLSYRRGIGFDTDLCCSYLDRLSVHRWTAGTDLTWPKGNTFLLAMLADGETYTDASTGFTVTQVSHDDISVQALVHLGNGCGSVPPSLSLTPQTQSGFPGTTVAYDVNVMNNDAPTCAPAVLSLAGSIPPGWTASLSQSSLQVGPGQNGHATLTTASPVGATPGTYSETVNVSDVNVPAHAASIAASYNVAPSCMAAPALSVSPGTLSAASGKTVTYSITVKDNDAAGCQATPFALSESVPTGWTATLSPAAMTLAPGATAVSTYAVTSTMASPAGTYGIWTTISDGSNPTHTGSASVSYIIPAGDTLAPSAPTGLTALLKGKQVNLSWRSATDNVGVVGYTVWRNGVSISRTTATSSVDSAVATGSTYTYAVVAYDAAGNVSALSNSVSVKLSSGGKGK